MRRLRITILALLANALFLSCENDSTDATKKELSSFAKNYLTMKIGSMSSSSMASANGFADAANASLNRIAIQNNLSIGRSKQDSTETKPDSAYYPSPWISCAQVTTTMNRDNSVTTTYDYGDGCLEGNDYFKYLLFGRYSYTYLYENGREGSVFKDHYFGNYVSENYGGEYYYEGNTSRWMSNGNSSYSGTSEYDTATLTYKGFYEYEADDEYTYDSMSYHYSGRARGTYTEKGSVLEINDYSYISTDYRYETTVLEPLVSRYDCYQNYDKNTVELAYCFMPVYVSGKEFIKYFENGQEGSFIIEYGDGECDGKIVIIENGNRVEVDLYGSDWLF